MKQKDLLFIAGFTFLTVLIWIGLGIYHTKVTSTVSQSLEQKIEPIEPQFNTKTIENLKNQRKSVSILPEISLSTPSATPTLKPTPTPIQSGPTGENL